MNLAHRGEFAEAIAADGRSYSKVLFERAISTAQRRAIKNSGEIAVLVELVEKVEVVLAEEAEDEEGEEVPDEFLDPLM